MLSLTHTQKEVDHAHQDLVTFLQSKANSLRIPWLQPCKQKLASTDNLVFRRIPHPSFTQLDRILQNHDTYTYQ